MSNIKLTGHTWDTSGIYDAAEGKTQAEVNSGLKTAENYISNINTQRIIINNSYSFTAVSSSTWQSGYQEQLKFNNLSGAKNITIKADSANGYGTSLFTLYFYDDASKTTILKTYNVGAIAFNADPHRAVSIPTGCGYIEIYFALISSSFGTHVPTAGDVAYINNLVILFDEVSLNGDINLPQIDRLDPSVIYTLQDSWANKIQSIQNAQGNNFTFCVQTDTHFGDVGTDIQESQYPDLCNNLSKLTEYVGFDFIVNLGDVIRGYATDTTAEMLDAYTEIMHRYVTNLHCPLLVTLGNHDTNVMYAKAQSDPTLQITSGQMYAKIMPFVRNSTPTAVYDGRSLYYYVDFDDADIRVIVLNTTDGNYSSTTEYGGTFEISENQLNWFTTTALNTTKKIILICHCPLVSDLTSNTVTNRDAVINALLSFKGNGGTVIGCFYGHTHIQSSAVIDGLLHVCFTYGGYCGEVVMIDTANKTINTIGLGTDTRDRTVNNRTFTYT